MGAPVTTSWLGIDVGTQSVKAAVVADDGRRLGAASVPLRSVRNGSRHEQDPALWFAAAADAARAAVAAASGVSVSGVSLCATSGTLVALDAAGRPTSPGVMYDDTRAAEYTAEVRASDPALWARLGFDIQPSWALPKLVWFVRNGLPTGTTRLAHQADAVAGSIVGGLVDTDWSNGLKSGVDLGAGTWSDRVVQRLLIPRDVLPDVVSPGSPLGVVSATWADYTGIAAGAPVFAGVTDGCAAQFAAGAVAPGDWHSIVGTTLIVKGVTVEPLVGGDGVVYSHRAPDSSGWLPGGASSAGAGVLSHVLPAVDLSALGREIEQQLTPQLIVDAPFAYPVVGRGERFPFAAPQLRGILRLDGRDHLLNAPVAGVANATVALAVYLGVAAVERLVYERLEQIGAPLDGRFTTSGGAVRSAVWNALRATMLGRDLWIPADAEPAAGAAALAAWGCERLDDPTRPFAPTAQRMGGPASRVSPRDDMRDAVDEYYRRFRSVLSSEGWLAA